GEGWHGARDVGIDETVRFEGDIDPADEAALFALDCVAAEQRATRLGLRASHGAIERSCGYRAALSPARSVS
ncbi:MAG: hypothetical protein IH940_12630, partial [Acidobacteria bacterium]|nr:hypothetical protein [Acidobacteriota bacterium]